MGMSSGGLVGGQQVVHLRRGLPYSGQQVGPPGRLIPISRCGVSAVGPQDRRWFTAESLIGPRGRPPARSTRSKPYLTRRGIRIRPVPGTPLRFGWGAKRPGQPGGTAKGTVSVSDGSGIESRPRPMRARVSGLDQLPDGVGQRGRGRGPGIGAVLEAVARAMTDVFARDL